MLASGSLESSASRSRARSLQSRRLRSGMSRDANIPLALWICAAIVAHWVGGGSAVEVAKVAQDRADLRALARGVREQLHPPDTTFEVLADSTEPTTGQKVAPL